MKDSVTSYVMELYENHLAHTYWGKRIGSLPLLDELYPFWFGADFYATDIPGRRFNSSEKLPQEYPTYDSADLREPALHISSADGNTLTRLHCEAHRIYDGKPAQRAERLRLQGLEPDAVYKDTATGKCYEGSTLMYAGIPLDARGDMTATLTVFEKQ